MTELMADFERGARNGMKHVFKNVTIKGCFAHFTRAVFKNLKKCGLIFLYKRNAYFKKWAKRIMAIPLLPVGKLLQKFENLLLDPFDGFSVVNIGKISKF